MGTEIERKFLLRDPSVLAGRRGVPIVQGYPVKEVGKMSLRVRIYGEQAYLTLKSPRQGIRRHEFEYPIPLDDARLLIDRHCDHRIVRKTRYLLPYRGQRFEVDVFSGLHDGLIVAELELGSEQQVVIRPPWLGEDVSHDSRYGNFSLALAEQAFAKGLLGQPELAA